MSGHAKLSPSGAHRWMPCPGSVVLEADFPDNGSDYAREGTAAHELAAGHLAHGWDLNDYIGEHWNGEEHDGSKWKVGITAPIVEHVMDYCNLVREYAEGGTLMVEQRVPIGHLTGEEGAGGTSDAVIIKGDTLIMIDLKFGMGVKVDAQDNPQLAMYALGTYEEFGVLADFTHVVMVIHQPRLNHVSEWTVTTEELLAFGEEVRKAASCVGSVWDGYAATGEARFMEEPLNQPTAALNPGEKQCKFCKAKAVCPALRAEVTEMVGGSSVASAEDFAQFMPEVPDSQIGANYLSMAMSKVELVEQWCKGVRAEVERRLLVGTPVEGFKLVQGKQGPRKWTDEIEAEKMLKSFRLREPEMYDRSIISPTTAEKVLKTSPKRWEKAQSLITRSEGKKSVAPATDKRPALAVQSVADDFRDVMPTAN